MNQQQQHLAQMIQKIDIFHGLHMDEVHEILHMCKTRTFAPNEQIYKAGAPSDEMLVLLKGQLVITSASGEPLGSVTAGHPIGEMGVFTGQTRSATVTAATESGGFTLRKLDIDIIMSRNPTMYVKVLKNVMMVLCNRLMQANKQNEQHLKTIMRLREVMEKQGAESEDSAAESA